MSLLNSVQAGDVEEDVASAGPCQPPSVDKPVVQWEGSLLEGIV